MKFTKNRCWKTRPKFRKLEIKLFPAKIPIQLSVFRLDLRLRTQQIFGNPFHQQAGKNQSRQRKRRRKIDNWHPLNYQSSTEE